jgi:pimeloyl-ACP methyl ester carboxylesterase
MAEYQASTCLQGDHALGYHLFAPATLKHPRLLVLVHGRETTAEAMIRLFAPIARTCGIALLAPDFSDSRFKGYQQLRGSSGKDAAAIALDKLARLQANRLGLEEQWFDLFGFSAGAQFAHRFALALPGRTARLIVAAAGWYTDLSCDRPFPHGLGRYRNNLKQFLHIPMLLLVGADDCSKTAKSLRRSPDLDARQGEDRVARARNWLAQIEQQSATHGLPCKARLAILPNTGHSLHEAIALGGLEIAALKHLLADRDAGAGEWPQRQRHLLN